MYIHNYNTIVFEHETGCILRFILTSLYYFNIYIFIINTSIIICANIVPLYIL